MLGSSKTDSTHAILYSTTMKYILPLLCSHFILIDTLYALNNPKNKLRVHDATTLTEDGQRDSDRKGIYGALRIAGFLRKLNMKITKPITVKSNEVQGILTIWPHKKCLR